MRQMEQIWLPFNKYIWDWLNYFCIYIIGTFKDFNFGGQTKVASCPQSVVHLWTVMVLASLIPGLMNTGWWATWLVHKQLKKTNFRYPSEPWMHTYEINKKRHFPVCFIIPLHAGSSPRSIIPSEYTWIIISPVIWHLDTLVTVTAIPMTSQGSAVLGAGTLDDHWCRVALQGFILCECLDNFCEPWWWAWELGVSQKLAWCSCQCLLCCWGLVDCNSMLALTLDHGCRSSQMGLGAGFRALLGFQWKLWCGLQWLWWGNFHPIGWCYGHKDLFLPKRDEWFHDLLGVLTCSQPGNRVDWGLQDEPTQPSTAKPSCKQWYSGTKQDGCPGWQTPLSLVGGGSSSWQRSVLEVM